MIVLATIVTIVHAIRPMTSYNTVEENSKLNYFELYSPGGQPIELIKLDSPPPQALIYGGKAYLYAGLTMPKTYKYIALQTIEYTPPREQVKLARLESDLEELTRVYEELHIAHQELVKVHAQVLTGQEPIEVESPTEEVDEGDVSRWY